MLNKVNHLIDMHKLVPPAVKHLTCQTYNRRRGGSSSIFKSKVSNRKVVSANTLSCFTNAMFLSLPETCL